MADDKSVWQARAHVKESLDEFERLCDLHVESADAVYDALNAMHEDDVRHMVLSLVLREGNAEIASGEAD